MARRKPRTAKRRRHLQQERDRKSRGFMTLKGPVADRECRLSLTVVTPPGVAKHQRKVTAIVDTGCTMTAIRPDIVKDLGLPVIRTANVATASTGKNVVVCDVVLAMLSLKTADKAVTSHRELLVADMSNEMLFGMDAMSGGVLEVDLVKNKWRWSLQHVKNPGRS